MKKLKTNNVGRMPFWQSDLNWIQEGFTEPLEALVKELGMSKSYFAITGCVPYKPNIKTLAMPAGWFWWNGSILPVRALPATDVLSFTNPVVRLTKVTYFNPDGARSFIHTDLSTETVSDVWQDDYLVPEVVERSASFISGVRLGIGAWTLSDILMHHIGENESDLVQFSYEGESSELYYKRIGRLVVFSGSGFSETSPSTDFELKVTGLPAPINGIVALDNNHILDPEGNIYLKRFSGALAITLPSTWLYIATTPYQATDPNTINDNPQA